MAIAKEVAVLTKDHTVIYVSLLYDLPYYSWVPLFYIIANYDIVIAYLVEELLSTIICPKTAKIQRAIEQKNFDLVGIKLMERCYDLEHADGYQNQQYAKILARETLDVDLPIARQFFPIYWT